MVTEFAVTLLYPVIFLLSQLFTSCSSRNRGALGRSDGTSRRNENAQEEREMRVRFQQNISEHRPWRWSSPGRVCSPTRTEPYSGLKIYISTKIFLNNNNSSSDDDGYIIIVIIFFYILLLYYVTQPWVKVHALRWESRRTFFPPKIKPALRNRILMWSPFYQLLSFMINTVKC